MYMLYTLGLFLLLSGYVIGLGAVNVIDWHGFLARKSRYWTEATIRTHKVTKPLIWVGTVLALLGGILVYQGVFLLYHSVIFGLLVCNGLFLTFRVSPYLLRREQDGKATELLPRSWQRQVLQSFVLSDIGWWGSLVMLVYYLSL